MRHVTSFLLILYKSIEIVYLITAYTYNSYLHDKKISDVTREP